MDRFIGNIDAKADAKGRVFVPAAFRKILQAAGNTQLILRKDIYQECLVLYPADAWNTELDLLRSRLNKYDEEQQQTFRQFVWESETLDMDANGRILIPKRYLQAAHIGAEIRFIGMNDTIEIWNRSNAEKPLMDAGTFRTNIRKFLIS
ncbi:MAG: cell division/cell wall cluster transcriptional repressor MraZ [Dysgonamonadaceae bacterium]|jgi:MraZ protein|nr:cell division/cell wall cluster transcriptional repressor MraZ [Dysgonamonadaceae bacterium]